MITYMEFTNVQIGENAWKSFGVTADALRCYYSTVYREDMTWSEFEDLALEYIENYMDDVISVEDAKMDFYDED